MPLDKPDPRYTTSKRAQQNFRLALRLSLAFIGVIWTVFILDEVFGLGLTRFGLRPGSVTGLIGLVTAPLLHGDSVFGLVYLDASGRPGAFDKDNLALLSAITRAHQASDLGGCAASCGSAEVG